MPGAARLHGFCVMEPYTLLDQKGEAMPSDSDSAYRALLVKIRQLEDETARLRLLIAELLVKNQQLRETGVEPQAR